VLEGAGVILCLRKARLQPADACVAVLQWMCGPIRPPPVIQVLAPSDGLPAELPNRLMAHA